MVYLLNRSRTTRKCHLIQVEDVNGIQEAKHINWIFLSTADLTFCLGRGKLDRERRKRHPERIPMRLLISRDTLDWTVLHCTALYCTNQTNHTMNVFEYAEPVPKDILLKRLINTRVSHKPTQIQVVRAKLTDTSKAETTIGRGK